MKLTDKWSIEFDGDNAILTFKEERPNKLGELKEYKDEFFYPSSNLKTALKAFLNKSLEGSESIEEVLKRIDEVEKIIESKC